MGIKDGSVLIVAVVLSTSGVCASPPAARNAAPSPRVVTLANSGATIVLRTGRNALLRLDHRRWRWSTPRLRGAAVTLEPIDYERDPGFDEWKIRARKLGRATIAVHGACETCANPDRFFRLAIAVRAG